MLLRVRALLTVTLSAALAVGATAVPGAPTAASSLARPAASLVALVNASAPAANLFAGQFCGAVLIGPREVLTVAHCLRHTDPRAVDAVIGADNLCQGRPVTGQRIHVAAVDTPPVGTGSDVVLLTLDRAASATPAKIAEVPAGDGQMGLAQGWGRSSLGGGYSCLPRTVPVTAGPVDVCREGLSAAVATQPTRECGAPPAAVQATPASGTPVGRCTQAPALMCCSPSPRGGSVTAPPKLRRTTAASIPVRARRGAPPRRHRPRALRGCLRWWESLRRERWADRAIRRHRRTALALTSDPLAQRTRSCNRPRRCHRDLVTRTD